MSTWNFGGTDLADLGRITLLDDSLDIADRRGSNVVIPFRHGTQFVEKYFDERVLTFGLVMTADTPADLESAIEDLHALLAVRGQQTLTKTLPGGAVRTALASVDKALQMTKPAPHIARLTIEFTLADPFFRSDTPIADNTTTINASPKAMVVTNPGAVEERDPTIVLTGPLQNTVITNNTNGSIFSYAGTIASPRVVTIQTSNGEFVAADDLSANKIASIGHQNSSALLVLDPGVNNLSITDGTHTTGTVKISFRAPYF